MAKVDNDPGPWGREAAVDQAEGENGKGGLENPNRIKQDSAKGIPPLLCPNFKNSSLSWK